MEGLAAMFGKSKETEKVEPRFANNPLVGLARVVTGLIPASTEQKPQATAAAGIRG